MNKEVKARQDFMRITVYVLQTIQWNHRRIAIALTQNFLNIFSFGKKCKGNAANVKKNNWC